VSTTAPTPPTSPPREPSKKENRRNLVTLLKNSIRKSRAGILQQDTSKPKTKGEEDDKGKKNEQQPHKTGFFSNNHVMMNRERSLIGIKTLHRSRYLDFLALSHAVDLAEDCQGVSHSVENLSDLQSLLNCKIVGENVQCGSSIREMHANAMKSRSDTSSLRDNVDNVDDGRWRNILREAYTEFGMATALGKKDGKLYMVQLFRGHPVATTTTTDAEQESSSSLEPDDDNEEESSTGAEENDDDDDLAEDDDDFLAVVVPAAVNAESSSSRTGGQEHVHDTSTPVDHAIVVVVDTFHTTTEESLAQEHAAHNESLIENDIVQLAAPLDAQAVEPLMIEGHDALLKANSSTKPLAQEQAYDESSQLVADNDMAEEQGADIIELLAAREDHHAQDEASPVAEDHVVVVQTTARDDDAQDHESPPVKDDDIMSAVQAHLHDESLVSDDDDDLMLMTAYTESSLAQAHSNDESLVNDDDLMLMTPYTESSLVVQGVHAHDDFPAIIDLMPMRAHDGSPVENDMVETFRTTEKSLAHDHATHDGSPIENVMPRAQDDAQDESPSVKDDDMAGAQAHSHDESLVKDDDLRLKAAYTESCLAQGEHAHDDISTTRDHLAQDHATHDGSPVENDVPLAREDTQEESPPVKEDDMSGAQAHSHDESLVNDDDLMLMSAAYTESS
jgi:hypothetical protein